MKAGVLVPLSRAEMEDRRLEALRLFQAGRVTSLSQLAKDLGVTRTSTGRWYWNWRNGKSLLGTKAPGRPAKLDWRTLQAEMLKIYREGPAEGQKWTIAAFAEEVERRWQIHYHPDYMGRVLHKIGAMPDKKRKGKAA